MKAVTIPSAGPNPPRAASVDVVLPCLDEAEALPWVLERIPPGWRALVVDNGSTDGSADVARVLGATVVREERRGFGAACHAGLTAATADIVCFCDCDATLDPGDLVPFVRRIAAGESDLVLGRRRPESRGAWPLRARAGNLAVTRLLHRRTGLRLHDLGPLRAARREPLLALALTDRRSGYPLQMVVRAADAGWRIAEHDVPYRPRTGASKVTGTWRGTWQAVRDMSRVLADGGGAGEPVTGAVAAAGDGAEEPPARATARAAAPESAERPGHDAGAMSTPASAERPG
ncbi:glycosyltransferase family 2 protein, partial [Streptomyces chartreusis]|uniref:glycosyltransferase family 2 protein n=1 Tax=Streptomyces chartreusis TaxID=1969 RepID=UPI003F4E33E9